MANFTDLDQVWLVVSPQNPLKEKATLLADFHRLSLVRCAIEDNPKLKVSDIEFKLEKPSYTVVTLAHLKEKHPEHSFALIMGEDNLRGFHKWFNFEKILNDYSLYVYPRGLTEDEAEAAISSDLKNHKNIRFCHEAPTMRISASFIRDAIKNKKDVRYLLTESVFNYVDEMNFYK
jgi:nicotinate-nucleotide adenylyltransferase